MRRADAMTVCLMAAATSLSYPAVALATDADDHGLGIETTFFGGYRSGGAFRETVTITAADETTGVVTRDVHLKDSAGFGVAINWQAEPDAFYEVAYSRQTTSLRSKAPIDLKIEYLQIGGYATFGEGGGRTIPYVLITIGAARFSPDTVDLDAITKLAGAIGTGIKYPMTKHLALRLDVRLYAAFFASQASIFCPSTEAQCVQSIRGTTFWQPDVALGLTVKF